MLAWMLYVIMVTLLLSIGAFFAERAARLTRGRTRWIWLTAIVASLLIPTVVASVSVQLPDFVSPRVAQKMVVLREATTQVLSPVMWISGSAGVPGGWRNFDGTLTMLWRAASAAMLFALLASGIHVLVRKRRWKLSTVSGAQVYVTEGVGPAVVGLLRPRIVVPRWVTMAPAPHQTSVIAHEQSHLDAHDPQLFTLALALLVFMPWNLPLWWQLRRLRYAIEVDCDARVLEGGVDPTHYGETLISVGERQSAYIGAVAAMSESKSFLEERIRIMISKPVRWRRVGMAALAGISIGLTALAAQVSPPNAVAGKRTEIKLPAETLDRYVGSYRMNDSMFIEVKREGDRLTTRATGQPTFEIYAESEDHFFVKAFDAQIEFANDGSGLAPSAVLHQNGNHVPLTRVDSSAAVEAQAKLDARRLSNAQQPGSEAALRRTIAAQSAGTPNYDEMGPLLEKAAREQAPMIAMLMKQMGPVQTVTYKGVGNLGWDVYEVRHANGTLTYSINMSPDGKIQDLLTMGAP
jgi:bla regulator protein blaR1